jgi:hypothetical protein
MTSGGGVGVSVAASPGVGVAEGCKTRVLVGVALGSTGGKDSGGGSVGCPSAWAASSPVATTRVLVDVGSGVLVGVAVDVDVGVNVGGTGVAVGGGAAACSWA